MSIKVLVRWLLQLKCPLICFSRRFQMWRLALRHLTTHCIFTTLVKLSRWSDNLFFYVCALTEWSQHFLAPTTLCFAKTMHRSLTSTTNTFRPLCFGAWRKSYTTFFWMIQYVLDLLKGSVVSLVFYPWLVWCLSFVSAWTRDWFMLVSLTAINVSGAWCARCLHSTSVRIDSTSNWGLYCSRHVCA